MDFDLAQVRAFVVVADHHHFGHAAERLNLSQQAVSRRIQRLEERLGTQLLVRGTSGVGLTADGARFLPYARTLLAQADAARSAVVGSHAPLRVDVWSHLPLGPLRLVESLTGTPPLEVSMRRSLWSSIEALRRDELDVAFGRVRDLDHPWPNDLRRRLVQLEPTTALVGAGHPLAGTDSIDPHELAGSTMWAPPVTTAPEFLGWFDRFARAFRLRIHHQRSAPIPDIAAGVSFVAKHHRNIAIVPAQTTLTDRRAVVIPLVAPVPHMPWSVVWRRDDRSAALSCFLHRVIETSAAHHWTDMDPAGYWIPEPDRLDLA